MGRAPCCDKATVKRGPWSPEEDSKLKDYMDKYGTGGNWIDLPQKAGLKRCGKSCRLRWLNYLRPNLKHGEFTDEEDKVICSLFASIGSRWSIIAAQLPGRTDNDIKNYWNTKLKKKLMALSLSTQSQRKSPPFPYSHQTLPSTSMYKPIQPMLQYDPFNNNSTILSTNSSLNNTISESPGSYYTVKEKYLMFGSTEPSCSSSDGSCSHISYGNREIKQEDMSNNFQGFWGSNNGYEDNQKFLLSYGDQNVNQQHGETPLDYDIEDVKRLIESNNNNLFIDENKTQEKAMYNYYY